MSKNALYPLWLIFILFGLITPVFAADKILDVSKPEQFSIVLTEYFAVLEDATHALTIDDLKEEDVAARFSTDIPPGEALNFSYTISAYWLRLRLKNSSDTAIERLFEIAYAKLADIQIHQFGEQNYQYLRTGYAIPFEQRPYKYRFFVLPMTIAAHSEQLIYFRIQTPNALHIPARLWEKQAFLAYERKDNITQALFFGMVIAMALYNLFLFSVLRDVSYLLYVMFSCCFMVAMVFYTGLSNELFPWSDTVAVTQVGTSFSMPIVFVFFLLFMRKILNTATLLPKLDSVIKLFIVINAVLPLFIWQMFDHFVQPKNVVIALTSLLILVISVICVYKRQRSAYFFIAAFGLLFMTILTISLNLLSIISSARFSFVGQVQFSSTLEMLLLSFALADRFYILRLEKETAQQQLVDSLKLSEKILETRVQQRTTELENAGEQLRILVEKERDNSIEKSNFIAMLTHELKSPLSTIKFAVGNIQRSQNPEIKAMCLHDIQTAAHDMSVITERCIDADKLENADTAISASPFSLKAIIEDIIQRHNSVNRVRLALEPPFLITSDALLCGIILSNFLENALKYSPEHSQVDIFAAWTVDKSAVLISVCNQIGTSGKPDSNKVFAKYYRNTHAQRLRGTGLGLWLVRGIATQLGAEVSYIDHNDTVEFQLCLPQ